MNRTQFVAELGKLRPSATFLSVVGYRNEFSEVADYSIVFHMSYENALKRSITKLKSFKPDTDFECEAKEELLASFKHSLHKIESVPVEKIDDAYTRFFNNEGNYIRGVKLHTKTQALHLYGLINHKRIIMPGYYPRDSRRELTVIKDKLRQSCPIGKFRQFRILPSQVDKIVVENLSLLPPS